MTSDNSDDVRSATVGRRPDGKGMPLRSIARRILGARPMLHLVHRVLSATMRRLSAMVSRITLPMLEKMRPNDNHNSHATNDGMMLAPIMEDDDLLTEVLLQLSRSCASGSSEDPSDPSWPSVFATLKQVSKRVNRLAKHDLIWQEVCERRWHGQLHTEAWQLIARDAVHASALRRKRHDPSPCYDDDDDPATWMRQYFLREKEIVCEHPVFAMGGNIMLGGPVGLHLFEPRYRLLIRHAIARDPAHPKFIFAGGHTTPGDIVWLCECHQVSLPP